MNLAHLQGQKQLMAARAATGGRPFTDWASRLSDNPQISAQTMTGRNQQRISAGTINSTKPNEFKDPMWNADHEDDYDNARNVNAGNAGANSVTGAHAGDLYKQPYHPTYSNETLLHQPGVEGGQWASHGEGLTGFTPSKQNLSNMPGNQLPNYFASRETQGTVLHMPDGKNFAGSIPKGEGIAQKTSSNPLGQTSPYELKPWRKEQKDIFGERTPAQNLQNAWDRPALLDASQRNAKTVMESWSPGVKNPSSKNFGLTQMRNNIYGDK